MSLPPVKLCKHPKIKSDLDELLFTVESSNWAEVQKLTLELDPNDSLISLISSISKLREENIISKESTLAELLITKDRVKMVESHKEKFAGVLSILESEVAKILKKSIFYSNRYQAKLIREGVVSNLSVVNSFQIKKVCLGDKHALFLSEDGYCIGIGDNTHGQLSDYNHNTQFMKYCMLNLKSANKITLCDAGPRSTCLLTNSNNIIVIGEIKIDMELNHSVDHLCFYNNEILCFYKNNKKLELKIIEKGKQPLVIDCDLMKGEIQMFAKGKNRLLILSNYKLYEYKQATTNNQPVIRKMEGVPAGLVTTVASNEELVVVVINKEIWVWGNCKSGISITTPITVDFIGDIVEPTITVYSNRVVILSGLKKYEWFPGSSTTFREVSNQLNKCYFFEFNKSFEIEEKPTLSIKKSSLFPAELDFRDGKRADLNISLRDQYGRFIYPNNLTGVLQLNFSLNNSPLQNSWKVDDIQVCAPDDLLISEVSVKKSDIHLSLYCSSKENELLILFQDRRLSPSLTLSTDNLPKEETKNSTADLSTTYDSKSKSRSVSKKLPKDIFLKPIIKSNEDGLTSTFGKARSRSFKKIITPIQNKEKSRSKILNKEPVLEKMFKSKKRDLTKISKF